MLAIIFYRVPQSSLNVRARRLCGHGSWDGGGDDGSDKRRWQLMDGDRIDNLILSDGSSM